MDLKQELVYASEIMNMEEITPLNYEELAPKWLW